jgi:PAS domain S-box-containing protein/putative nucleotidyltransferase with HDIG domain
MAEKIDTKKREAKAGPGQVRDLRLLEAILQGSPIPAFAINRQHKVIFWNRALEELTGIKGTDMLGTGKYWRLFFQEKRELMADLLLEGRADQAMQSYPLMFQKSKLISEAYEATNFFPDIGKSGSWLRFTASLLRNDKGEIIGALETIEDITERGLAEELYEKLANNSPVGIFVAQEGKFIFINAQFQKSTGYTMDELAGRNVLSIVHSGDRAAARKNAVEMLKGDRVAPYEFRIKTKQGDTRWIMETVTSIPFRGGKAILGSYMDITEQKEWRSSIEELETLEASILDAIPHAVLGLKDRRIIFANDAVATVFGWDPGELIGKSTRVLYRSDEEYEQIASDFYPALENSPTFMEEFTCRRKDGRDIICMVSTSRIGSSLKNRRIVATYEDITARKKAETDLKQSFEKVQKGLEDTIQTIAMIVQTRDPYTAGHQRQVDKLATAIGREMGLSEDRIKGIRAAALLHDIGKIYVPAEMLSRPGHLSETEYDIMKKHPQVSFDILKMIEFPWPVAEIVSQHHERLNGSGYPGGLKGAEILLEARILAVADVVESMASHRPYRPTIGMDKALAEINDNKGTLYDPEVVDVCIRLLTEKGFKFD